MQYPAYSFSQGKDTGPAPHKGAAGGTLRPRGGAAGARSAHKAGAGGPEGRPAPALVWLAGGPEAPPPPNAAAPPGRCDFLLHYRFPTIFPSVTHHTPKAFWKPPKAVSKAEPFAALGEAPLTPFATMGEAHFPSAPHFPSATSQGSGGGAAPSRGSRGAAAPGLGGANITKYLLPNPYRNLHLSPYLHIKRPPLGRWHRKPSPLGGVFL